jgi:uncharacterized protein YkwD
MAALALALLLTGCTEQQIELIDRINASRAEHGLPALTPHPSAMAKAQAWAETMAADGELRHSELSDGITGEWLTIGENVGFSGDIPTVHQAFLDSESHRANILDERFNWVGTGYAEGDDGRIWVAQVFVQY